MGARILYDNSAAISAKLRKQVDAVTRKAAQDVSVNAVVNIMSGPKTGRVYDIGGETSVVFNAGNGIPFKQQFQEKTVVFNKGKTGRKHQASAPGESPATDTGALVNSIRVKKVSEGHYRVTANTKYARILEYGGRNIAPRPYLLPALESIRPSFLAAVRSILKNS